jgi:hypothetical protein
MTCTGQQAQQQQQQQQQQQRPRVAQAASRNAPPASGAVCAACLGSLGLFGNSVLQLIACQLTAEQHGLRLQVNSAQSQPDPAKHLQHNYINLYYTLTHYVCGGLQLSLNPGESVVCKGTQELCHLVCRCLHAGSSGASSLLKINGR